VRGVDQCRVDTIADSASGCDNQPDELQIEGGGFQFRRKKRINIFLAP
jgi:hypothetical protein